MNFCQLLFSLFKSLNWLTGFISWTKPQVQARSHPNILAATAWLSKLYHVQVVDKGNSKKNEQLANSLEGVDLNVPLMYADRFRIRTAGSKWDTNLWIPHVDGECHTLLTRLRFNQDILVGGSIERWEDPFFRKCFESIFNGNWKDHDPFALEGRLDARNSLYGKPEQSSVFRTFQGWISMTWLFWRHDNTCTTDFADRWFNPVRPLQPKALLVFTLMFCSRMHTWFWDRSSAQQCLLTRKMYTMPITGSSVSPETP